MGLIIANDVRLQKYTSEEGEKERRREEREKGRRKEGGRRERREEGGRRESGPSLSAQVRGNHGALQGVAPTHGQAGDN